MGRDWMQAAGITLMQINAVQEVAGEFSSLVDSLFRKYPGLLNTTNVIKKFELDILLKDEYRPIQVKPTRIPYPLQERVDKEVKRLESENHIERIDCVRSDKFSQPIVINIKKDNSVKLALDARRLNEATVTKMYPMPNIENYLERVGGLISKSKSEPLYFSTIDLQYAFGQIKLSRKLSSQCNFGLIGGESSGNWRFLKGFYGLADLPLEFQRLMDHSLGNIAGVFPFLDDILVVSRGDKFCHFEKLEEVFVALDKLGTCLCVKKCHFFKKSVKWLGYEVNEYGYSPLVDKIEAIPTGFLDK